MIVPDAMQALLALGNVCNRLNVTTRQVAGSAHN
jgi:hypothetical protein